MLLFPRRFSCQGKAAIRALKLGFALARCDAPIRGANLRATNVADEFPLLSMAFPLVAPRLNATFQRNWLNSGYFRYPIGTLTIIHTWKILGGTYAFGVGIGDVHPPQPASTSY